MRCERSGQFGIKVLRPLAPIAAWGVVLRESTPTAGVPSGPNLRILENPMNGLPESILMKYSAGIIGAGGVAGMGLLGTHDNESIGAEKAEASHAGGYAATEELELVSIADIDQEKLDRFGDAWELPPSKRYQNHEQMLAEESLDVVSVCTPTTLHHRHVVDAARSPANPDAIWCEKPIATRLSAADEMIKVCDETATELVINHSFRFTTKLQRLRTLIQRENILGDVRSVSSQFRMELLRNSTHLLDTLLFLTNGAPDRVSGYITGENEAVDALDVDIEIDDAGGGGFVIFEDGVFATIDCTLPREISSMNYVVIGTEGKLYLNNDDGEWRYWRLSDGEHQEEQLSGIDSAWTWENDYREAFGNAASHLVDILEGRSSNLSPGGAAKQSLEIIVAFYLSHHTGATVSLPLERPLRNIEITSW